MSYELKKEQWDNLKRIASLSSPEAIYEIIDDVEILSFFPFTPEECGHNHIIIFNLFPCAAPVCDHYIIEDKTGAAGVELPCMLLFVPTPLCMDCGCAIGHDLIAQREAAARLQLRILQNTNRGYV